MYAGIDIFVVVFSGLGPLPLAVVHVSAKSFPVIEAFGDVIHHGCSGMAVKFADHVICECLMAVLTDSHWVKLSMMNFV